MRNFLNGKRDIPVMVNKSGQISTFIIFGIFMLVLISLFLVSESNENKEAISFVETKMVRNFVEQCLTDTTENTLRIIATQGGYNELPELSTTQSTLNVPYYFYNGTRHIPTIEQVQENSAERIQKNIRQCLNFSRFTDVTIVQSPEPRIHVLFMPISAEIKLRAPIAIQKEVGEIIIDQFIVHIPTRLLQMYDYATRIIENQNRSEQYCMSCVMTIKNRAGFTTETINTHEGTIITLRKGEEHFSFAMR